MIFSDFFAFLIDNLSVGSYNKEQSSKKKEPHDAKG